MHANSLALLMRANKHVACGLCVTSAMHLERKTRSTARAGNEPARWLTELGSTRLGLSTQQDEGRGSAHELHSISNIALYSDLIVHKCEIYIHHSTL
jgi:hypothetical protein